MSKNWKLQSIENLENNVWPSLKSDEESYLIITCNSLRKKKLIDFSVEDLRIMIGQSIGLKYLIPIAIEILSENIFAEGDYYEGDLLNSVLASNQEFWIAEKKNHQIVCDLFKKNESIIKDFDTTWEIKKRWFELFKHFEIINKNVC